MHQLKEGECRTEYGAFGGSKGKGGNVLPKLYFPPKENEEIKAEKIIMKK